jgi:predicted HTH transcriptional regulator
MIKATATEFADVRPFKATKKVDEERTILEMIAADRRTTAARMAETLNVSERTVKRYLSSMTKKGMIRRVGSDKAGHWGTIDNWG